MTKKTVFAAIFLLAALLHADTPLVQALKVEQQIKDTMLALDDVNVGVRSFKQAPDAIRNLTRIGDFYDGKYSGPIICKNSSFSNTSFKNLAGIFDVYMPNLITVINDIFYPAPGIRSFYGPKVTSVGYNAFYNSSNLGIVDLPECTYIDYAAFINCTSLTNINIPKVTSTGVNAFENCNKLKGINCQPLATVNNYAFQNCTSLTNIPLRKAGVTFNKYCFNGCQSLDIKEDEWPNSVSLAGYGYQFYNCKSLKNINPLLAKLTGIDGDIYSSEYGYRFYGCSSLTDLHSDNIQTLNCGYLFANCTSVTNISFPNLISIGSYTYVNFGYMFYNMTSLKHIDMPNLQSISKINNRTSWSIFNNCTALEEIEFPSLEYLGNMDKNNDGIGYMFGNCTSLRSAKFPKLVELQIYGNTENHAMFPYCYNLEELYMPALKILRNSAYYFDRNSLVANNYALKEVSFPELEQIWQVCSRLFYYCHGLKKVTMPKLTYCNNKEYGDKNTQKGLANMFYLCPALTDVTFGFKADELISYPGFASCANQNTVFHCPADAPYNVDVMYLNNAWTVVTNGTFKLVDSIKGTGTQYINTGYVHKTNTVVEVDFAVGPEDSPNRWEYIFGSRSDSNTANSYGVFSYVDNARRWGYQRNSHIAGDAYSLDAETNFKIVCASNNCSVYDASGAYLYSMTASGIPNAGVGPLAIFACNETATFGAFSPNQWKSKNLKLNRFTVKEDDETVMDLVPALVGGENTSQVPCLVDLKNNYHPLFNAGSGSFEVGSVTNSIPVPSSGE